MPLRSDGINYRRHKYLNMFQVNIIYALTYGSPARLINHSHDLNVTYEEWHCSGKEILISSCREIFATPEKPAEVLADYGWILDPEDD